MSKEKEDITVQIKTKNRIDYKEKLKDTSLISIIVPIYNAEKYLSDCIQSIQKQTYQNIEIILVNDGSTDSSLEICRKYQKGDSRIQVIDKDNSGVSHTRNIGIERAAGDYIAFIDADDWVKENYLEQLFKALKANSDKKAAAVYCGYIYDYNGSHMERFLRLENGIYHYNQLKNRLMDDGTLSGILLGSACGALYNLSIIKKYQIRFPIQVKKNEDGIFNLEYIYYGKNIVIIDQALYGYRQWKKKTFISLKQKDSFTIHRELNQATYAIKSLYKRIDPEYIKQKEFHQQMAARKISVTFWCALYFCQSEKNIRKCFWYVKHKFEALATEDFHALAYSNMNVYKKILVKIMCLRYGAIIFVPLIRWIYLPFQDRIRR